MESKQPEESPEDAVVESLAEQSSEDAEDASSSEEQPGFDGPASSSGQSQELERAESSAEGYWRRAPDPHCSYHIVRYCSRIMIKNLLGIILILVNDVFNTANREIMEEPALAERIDNL